MYCITKRIYYTGGSALKGEYHSSSCFLQSQKNLCLRAALPLKLKTVIRHRERKKGDSVWGVFCSLSFFIVTAWWIPRWKMSPDPRENKTLWTVSSFFPARRVCSRAVHQHDIPDLREGRTSSEGANGYTVQTFLRAVGIFKLKLSGISL